METLQKTPVIMWIFGVAQRLTVDRSGNLDGSFACPNDQGSLAIST